MTWFKHILKVNEKCVKMQGNNFYDFQISFHFGN
jgi:hypothetical protein